MQARSTDRDSRRRSFSEDVARILDLDPSVIRADSLLVVELGADSLSLAEILALMLTQYGVDRLSTHMETVDRASVRVQDLIHEIEHGPPREWRVAQHTPSGRDQQRAD
jgi:acyl carrier protein